MFKFFGFRIPLHILSPFFVLLSKNEKIKKMWKPYGQWGKGGVTLKVCFPLQYK
jgi:hypothetical protein